MLAYFKSIKSLNFFKSVLHFSNMTSKLPLVVIIGATACRKTKLSIEIAKRYNGQIISADSMQVI